MVTINVNTSKKYDVLIARDIISKTGELLSKLKKNCEIMLVSETNVFPLYGEVVKKSLEQAGYTVHTFVFEAGEQSKSLSVAEELLEKCADLKITRTGLMVALGGGVVGDLVGFVSSIYLRGIGFVQIPTTVLSAVDSSVGGKTAVNLKSGKNLAGAFHQPIAVFCDINTFDTLPKEIYSDGMCEVIKYGCIRDKDLFEQFKTDFDIMDIVAKCVQIKADVVENDEFDTGERMILNFGHTIAHGVEILSEFEVSHGYAVGIGMSMIAKIGEKLGCTKIGTTKEIDDILAKFNVSSECKYSPSDLKEIALKDKKRSSQTITLVMLKEIGECFLKEVSVDDLEEIFTV